MYALLGLTLSCMDWLRLIGILWRRHEETLISCDNKESDRFVREWAKDVKGQNGATLSFRASYQLLASLGLCLICLHASKL